MPADNLFANLPTSLPEELFERLVEHEKFLLERIVSTGQCTPPGEWYDQETHEWVVLLAGAAGLQIEGEATSRTLRPGDYVLLPAHCRHRVEWTDGDQTTVWLAVHFRD